MPKSILAMPEDPVELARLRAFEIEDGPKEISQDEDFMVHALEHAASLLGLLEKPYWVKTQKGLVMQGLIDTDGGEVVQELEDAFLLGTFTTYSQINLEWSVDQRAERYLSLLFAEARIMDTNEDLPGDSVLHVPVLAVERIQYAPGEDE